MKILAAPVLGLLALSLFAHAASGQQNNLRSDEAGQGLGENVNEEAPVSRPFLQDTWQGVLTAVGLDGDPVPGVYPPFPNDPGRQLGFRLAIGQTNLVMYLQNGDQWIPIGEGQDLRLNDQGRSSIVITALPGGATGNQIEVWLLNIMRWQEDSLLVHLSRTTGANPDENLGPSVLNLMGLLDRAS
jgi:hypothetical protein